jgi:23S rRNA pseudouridine1911/1915/1917 synthase
MNIPILFESPHILAINKPAGLIVHGDGKHNVVTVADWFAETYPEAATVGETIVLQDGTEIARPGIVHRLDKDTSGVMLLAKTQEAFLHLKEQFQNRTVQKTYHAFVYGNIREDTLVVNAPIGRSANGIRKWTSGKDIRNNKSVRDAETLVRVLERGKDRNSATQEVVTFIEAKPKTGRTHQIRVHCNYVGRPIVADSLYTKRAPLLGFERLALHAKEISFTDMNNRVTTVEAEYPDDFTFALQNLEKGEE